MMPFPETETMTIKRLEVALRKVDFKLLKEGAYKLHEKLHSGYSFECKDDLKEIYQMVINNENVPSDIKGILIPTLEDILSNINSTEYTNNSDTVQFSQLTSLSYSTDATNLQNQTNNQTNEAPEPKGEKKISAFDAFGSNNKIENPILQKQSFETFSTPNEIQTINNNSYTPENNIQEVPTIANYSKEEITQTKTVSIFYNVTSSVEKNKRILKYRELIDNLINTNTSFNEIINLTSEINTQANIVTNVGGILNQLKDKNVKINLITNSSSSSLIDTFDVNNISYSLDTTESKLNFIPLYGLSNLFRCSNCHKEYLDLSKEINAYVLECPECQSPMFPEYYCSNGKINLEYYNSAILNLASSDTLLVINISQAERETINIIRTSLNINKTINKIYIIDKDINSKETYKRIFNEINPNIAINTELNALDEFIKGI